MIRPGDRIFVDTGAWLAVSLGADPRHEEAAALLAELISQGGRPVTSVPVAIETFTYLQRKIGAEVARAWRLGMEATPRLELLECRAADLAAAWPWLERRDLHKLGIVDATSFVLMKRHKLRRAFAFDVHFATAGFALLRG